MVVGCRLTGFREVWKVPTEPHLVEVAQVLLTGLNWFRGIVVLHVVQWCTQRIRILYFLARFCMVTGHLVSFIPLHQALTDLLSLHAPMSTSMQHAMELDQDAFCQCHSEGLLDGDLELNGECLGEPGTAEPVESAGEAHLSELLSSILPP